MHFNSIGTYFEFCIEIYTEDIAYETSFHLPSLYFPFPQRPLCRFAISRTKGEISKEDEALVNAQRSVVDGPEKADSGMTETVTVNEGVDKSNCGEGGTCNEITSTGGGGGGAEKVDVGVLGGIADTLSSLWS